MKTKIIEGFYNGVSYLDYRKQVSDLLAKGKSTGNEQTEDLLHYSKLNETRMNRLDKTIQVDDATIKKLNSLQEEYIWLVLSEGWCGDAAQITPILNKMVATTSKIELKLVFRDENEALMNLFLTNGSKSIPKVIIIEKESMMVKGSWGPRPEGATNLIKSYKAQYGVVDETAKTELQMWYLHDKGLSTMNELSNLMVHLEELGHQKM
ncbi:thioredoxin family protein [Flavobacterium terrae]|uniref:Thioredoxin n=1 Tax=Flavobacterium terrae TaxID=415425 RepID=A0A1M6AXQ0_9FLAO|nr:thioredoxin family protein [Flavobacterium terrae]SHI41220.1 Thioredoxin [Flavobacterium terrae]